MSPKESIRNWLLTNVVAPFLLPLGVGVILVLIIAPASAGFRGMPGPEAWWSMVTAVEVLIVGLICAVGVGFEYSSLTHSDVKVPTLLRMAARACGLFFLVAFTAYAGSVYNSVLGASPTTAHLVKDGWRTVEPDFTMEVDTSDVDKRDKTKPAVNDTMIVGRDTTGADATGSVTDTTTADRTVSDTAVANTVSGPEDDSNGESGSETEEERSENPLGLLPVGITALLICTSGLMHFRIQEVATDSS